MSLPRYPEYKGSKVEWLGHVPAHWKVDRIKASIASARNGIWGDEPKNDANDIPCVRVADFDRSKLQVKSEVPTVRSITEKERASRLLNRGDLLLEKSGGGDLQPVGQVVMYQLDVPAVCSNFVAKVVLKQRMVPSYWNYVHNAAYSVGVNIGSINQTSGIQNLDQDRYFNERAPFPPESEQTAIAAFLDRETAKIDALIAEQEKLIALLAEKRQATISHAVTRGLNPDAPMKDSGVPWLGEVPAHWEMGCLKRFADVIDCKHFTVEFLDEGLPIASIRELRENRIDLKDAKLTSPREWDFLREGRVPVPGDLVFCRNASVGAVGYVSEITPSFCMGQDVCLIRPATKSKFMYYQLVAAGTVNQIEALLVGATIRRANVQEIRNLSVSCPPFLEQEDIAKFLDAETEKLDGLEFAARSVISLLKERRGALIAAAVTGQIDVRGQVPATASPSFQSSQENA